MSTTDDDRWPRDFGGGHDPLQLFLHQLGRAVAGGFTGLLWTVAAAAGLAVVTPARGAGAWAVTGVLTMAPLVGMVTGVLAVRHPWVTVRRRLLWSAIAAVAAMLLMQSGLNTS